MITDATRLAVANYVASRLGTSRGTIDDRTLTRDVSQYLGISGAPIDALQTYNVVRAERAAYNAGQQLTFPQERLAPSAHPRDYQLLASDRQFGYRVFVRITNRGTGDVRPVQTVIHAETPLSTEELEQEARQAVMDMIVSGRSTTLAGGLGDDDTIEVSIITAGRRR